MLTKEQFEASLGDDDDSDEIGQNDLTLMQAREGKTNLKIGEAYRRVNSNGDLENEYKPIDQFPAIQTAIRDVILFLNDLTKTSISKLYEREYNSVMDVLKRAFTLNEQNSMLLLGRSKKILHALTSQLESDIRAEVADPDKLKVIRLNSALNNSENKIQKKFCEALGLDNASQLTSIEMQQKVIEYFNAYPDLSILFIFEDIDYYVETTKQHMLYKIFDSLTQMQIKFVFLTTSQKMDVVDSFEKRIKSRFSHRSEMFYGINLENYLKQITSFISQRLEQTKQMGEMTLYVGYMFLLNMIESGALRDSLVNSSANGR